MVADFTNNRRLLSWETQLGNLASAGRQRGKGYLKQESTPTDTLLMNTLTRRTDSCTLRVAVIEWCDLSEVACVPSTSMLVVAVGGSTMARDTGESGTMIGKASRGGVLSGSCAKDASTY